VSGMPSHEKDHVVSNSLHAMGENSTTSVPATPSSGAHENQAHNQNHMDAGSKLPQTHIPSSPHGIPTAATHSVHGAPESCDGIKGMPSGVEISALRASLRKLGSPEERPDREFELGLFLLGWGSSSPNKAAEQYVRTLKWRSKFGVDQIRDAIRSKQMAVQNFPCAKAVQDAFPHTLVYLEAYARDGSPLAVTRVGQIDLKRLSTTVSLEHFQVCVCV
jgi:hypothetical protein